MKKNRLAIVTAAAAAVAVLAAGCGSDAGPNTNTKDASGTPELLIWTDTVREPAANAYKKSVQGKVEVKLEVVDLTQLGQKIELFNSTGEGWPDVVFAQPNEVAQWAHPTNGYAANLSDLVDPAVFEAFEGTNQWCEIEGNHYCFKNDLAHSVLWYNQKLMKKFDINLPTTMQEWATEAMKLKGTGYSAGAVGDHGLYANFLWPSGCPIASPEDMTTVRIDPAAEECTRVADLLQPLLDAKVIDSRSNTDAGFLSEVARKNKVVMTFGPSWWGEFTIRPEGNWGVPAGQISAAPMPKWDGNDEAYSGEWGGGIWVVSSHSKFPETAADAAVFLATDPEVRSKGVTYPASVPAYEAWSKRISSDDYYASDINPALSQQSLLISPSQGPVRYPLESQIGAVLQTEINSGAPVYEAVTAFQEKLINLAQISGYEVIQ